MPSKNFASIDTTDTLKGVAIAAVLINHYLNLNITGNWAGFAYQWVAIFFVLSGYGLFHSLERRFQDTISLRKVLIFYYERAIRIFPLLWLAWLIQLIISRGDISYWIPLGLNASGHYWFIPALLQCYVLSPIIYWSIKKNITMSTICIIFIFVFINIFFMSGYAPPILLKLAKVTNSNWMKLYFFHILVFTGGLLLPTLLGAMEPVEKIKVQRLHSVFFWSFTTLIVILFEYIKYIEKTSTFFREEMFLLPVAMIIYLCYLGLHYSIKSPFLKFIGGISYSLYLFHISFYLSINNFGRFHQNSLIELIVTIILFPAFVLLCSQIEKFGHFLSKTLRGVLTKYVNCWNQRKRMGAKPDVLQHMTQSSSEKPFFKISLSQGDQPKISIPGWKLVFSFSSSSLFSHIPQERKRDICRPANHGAFRYCTLPARSRLFSSVPCG